MFSFYFSFTNILLFLFIFLFFFVFFFVAATSRRLRFFFFFFFCPLVWILERQDFIRTRKAFTVASATTKSQPSSVPLLAAKKEKENSNYNFPPRVLLPASPSDSCPGTIDLQEDWISIPGTRMTAIRMEPLQIYFANNYIGTIGLSCKNFTKNASPRVFFFFFSLFFGGLVDTNWKKFFNVMDH